MRVYKSMEELIGSTPLLELENIEKHYSLKAKIYAKLEYLNPAGSAKDRVALEMINDGESKGLITKDTVIIEPTSGNTGIGLAAVAASRGYKALIVMPDTMSAERIKTIKAYGAEIILTDGKKGMQGAIDKAEELKKAYPSAIIAGQFTNPANPEAHYKTTGPEIYNDTDGKVDIFVCGVGTGGTITGTGRYLKEKNKNIKIVGVEPANSAVLSGGAPGKHNLQGIGAGFVPAVLDTGIYDEIIPVTDEEAYENSRLMGSKQGVLVGISSGAALEGALKLAKREENAGKIIVALLPDTGDRYLSTVLFDI